MKIAAVVFPTKRILEEELSALVSSTRSFLLFQVKVIIFTTFFSIANVSRPIFSARKLAQLTASLLLRGIVSVAFLWVEADVLVLSLESASALKQTFGYCLFLTVQKITFFWKLHKTSVIIVIEMSYVVIFGSFFNKHFYYD